MGGARQDVFVEGEVAAGDGGDLVLALGFGAGGGSPSYECEALCLADKD